MNRTFLVLGLLLSFSLFALATRPAKSPSQGDLVGDWVGFEASYPYFYRLDLRRDDTGNLVVLYPQGESAVYGLRWQLSEKQLQLNVLPLTTNAEMITCQVLKADFRRMTVVVSGVSNTWKRTAMLLNEKFLAAGIAESAKHASNAVAKAKDSNPSNRR